MHQRHPPELTDFLGRHLGRIDGSWSLRPLLQGGVVNALAARAMAAQLGGDQQSLRLLVTTIVAPVAHGTVEIEMEVVLRQRSMSHACA